MLYYKENKYLNFNFRYSRNEIKDFKNNMLVFRNNKRYMVADHSTPVLIYILKY